ncbi:MAG: helix-turn-helix transcriptional regulator [Paracoccaceae bacterium]|nr:helix-turn-helix transcriptional regulator [Paracoccaceae bacterium]
MTKNAIDRLNELMQDRRWNKADLAKALNASPQALTGWWRRGEIPGSRLASVAKIFDVSVEFLINGDTGVEQLPDGFDEILNNLTQGQQDELLAEATKMAETNQQALAIAKELQARRK